ncbi:MAG: HAD-IA family hydrolase [Proteobacteria bacterium]|jgi:putative hydrolase of the HAD superfamily|nr:HAD-IA family hydrolase [Pseudomonadota bacterium]MDA1299997.1 HAD-IA family hydrolase [Pseudomonadota bacterium]
MIKAVLWDFGGVITSSPFEAFNRYEKANHIPLDFIRSVNATHPESNAWAQLERSDISVAEFDDLFLAESRALGHAIAGADVLALLSGELRDEMVSALRIVKQHMSIGCITNNVRSGEGAAMARDHHRAIMMDEVFNLFDVLVESSKVGMRKPDPEIYQFACAELGVQPENAVFLDDLGVNLKPARALGMQTIKVLNANQALDDLEGLLGFSLRSPLPSQSP